MITLPNLAGVPPVLTASAADPLAAKCALVLAGTREIAPVSRRGGLLEHAVLLRSLTDWAATAFAPLTTFKPRVHLALGQAPSCGCNDHGDANMALWLTNAAGDSLWILENRFNQLERRAPGLAGAALRAMAEVNWRALPIFLPSVALDMVVFTWWYGEMDEKYALEEYFGDMSAADRQKEESPVPTRAWFDKLLPTSVTLFAGAAKLERLDRYARGGGEIAEIAKLVLELRAMKARRGRRTKHDFHGQADDLHCAEFAATVRWNTRDPMARAWDDHWHNISEGQHVEEAYGWFPVEKPSELPAALQIIEGHVSRARVVERLLPLIAERAKR